MEFKQEGYWICRHPAHPNPLEIFEATQLKKAEDMEGGYVLIANTDTYEAALERVQPIMMEVYRRDPQMKDIKTQIRDLYQ
jgi:hypothetical protein